MNNNVFDILGPIMIGPSSSHTAGACKIGYIARSLSNHELAKVEIQLAGSFAKTYQGHGTDKAILGGLMGMKPDDERIRDAFDIVKQYGLDYTFTKISLPDDHPNTVVLIITDVHDHTYKVKGSSIGAGNILINSINDLEVNISCCNHTLIVVHYDIPGMIAKVTDLITKDKANIFSFKLSRTAKGEVAVMAIELDNDLDEKTIKNINECKSVISVTYIKPL